MHVSNTNNNSTEQVVYILVDVVMISSMYTTMEQQQQPRYSLIIQCKAALIKHARVGRHKNMPKTI